MASKKRTAMKRIAAAAKKAPIPRLAVTAENATAMPTEADVRFVNDTPLPTPTTERVMHDIASAFTPRVCRVLGKPEAKAFFGSRMDSEQIVQDASLATDAETAAARFAHGAMAAQQIGAPAQQRLMAQASLIIDSAEDFIAAFPKLANDLQDLVTWWTATFPGGGPKQKPANTRPATTAPASVAVKS